MLPACTAAMRLFSAASFRVTRNSNLYLEEEETRNLLEVRADPNCIAGVKGTPVRLEIDANAQCGDCPASSANL